MIRLIRTEEVPAILAATGGWQLTRIQALLAAYGNSYDFCRLYLQEESGALLACLDDSAILYAPNGVAPEELAGCLEMTKASSLLADAAEAEGLLPFLPSADARTGKIMGKRASYATPSDQLVKADTLPALHKVHRLIEQGFGETGTFDNWYCDISHRIRHGVGQAFLYRELACAVAAEWGDRVLLSQIAVSPACRGSGYGSAMLQAVEACYAEKEIAIYSRNSGTDVFYRKLGFAPIGRWLELGLR